MSLEVSVGGRAAVSNEGNSNGTSAGVENQTPVGELKANILKRTVQSVLADGPCVYRSKLKLSLPPANFLQEGEMVELHLAMRRHGSSASFDVQPQFACVEDNVCTRGSGRTSWHLRPRDRDPVGIGRI